MRRPADGVGDSYINVLGFANQLTKLGITSVQPLQFNESISVSATAGAGDVALFVTYSGTILKLLKREMQILKKNKCRIILLSSVEDKGDADLLLRIPKWEEKYGKISVYYSQASLHYVLDCLYGAIFSMNFSENDARKLTYDQMNHDR